MSESRLPGAPWAMVQTDPRATSLQCQETGPPTLVAFVFVLNGR